MTKTSQSDSLWKRDWGKLRNRWVRVQRALCVRVQNLSPYMIHLLRSAVILLNVNGVTVSD